MIYTFLILSLIEGGTPCGPTKQMLDKITGDTYGELLVVDLSKNTMKFQVYMNPNTRSWSFVALPTPELACLIASGIGFNFKKHVPEGKEL